MKREAFVTILRDHAPEEEAQWFRASAAAMARAVHANVQTVYQVGQHQGRDFFAREKWDAPSLAELAMLGEGIDGRLAARIIRAVGAVVLFWDANGFPHAPLTAADVSVSAQGAVKVANCVDPALPAAEPGVSDLTALAAALQTLIPPGAEIPPRVQALLARLAAGPVPVAECVGEAQAIDNELAPEREIVVTVEKQMARRAVRVERRKQIFQSVS